ncbi:MAG: PDZ domain-containing protein [Gemmatimonadaceae bacterium]|nr:PDZ domain-containing protein [Gemmatimonadaceae bacterium]
MRNTFCIMLLLTAGTVAPAAAQVTVRTMPGSGVRSLSWTRVLAPTAVIGVTTSAGDARDTLGLLVTDVAAKGPAAKAGIQEGDRIQSINGIDLKLAPIDIGDEEMANAMSNRLTRELGKLTVGDNVSLSVYHNGQVKPVVIKTVSSGDLYGNPAGMMRMAEDNRAMLGVSLSVTGSKRDTLGVLVVAVDDSGPAAKAGLEEGNRLAAINGVNLKVDREDAGDRYVAEARYQRLQKEMAKVKPGDDVTLQVYADGHFKTVHVKATKASELGNAGTTFMFRGDGAPMMQFNVNSQQVRAQVQRAMDQVRQEMQRVRIEAPAPRVRWLDDSAAPAVISKFIPSPEPAPATTAAPEAPAAPSMSALPVIARIRASRAAMMLRPVLASPAPIRIIRF